MCWSAPCPKKPLTAFMNDLSGLQALRQDHFFGLREFRQRCERILAWSASKSTSHTLEAVAGWVLTYIPKPAVLRQRRPVLVLGCLHRLSSVAGLLGAFRSGHSIVLIEVRRTASSIGRLVNRSSRSSGKQIRLCSLSATIAK